MSIYIVLGRKKLKTVSGTSKEGRGDPGGPSFGNPQFHEEEEEEEEEVEEEEEEEEEKASYPCAQMHRVYRAKQLPVTPLSKIILYRHLQVEGTPWPQIQTLTLSSELLHRSSGTTFEEHKQG